MSAHAASSSWEHQAIKGSSSILPICLFWKHYSESPFKNQLLDSLKLYKSSQAVFEVNTTSKGLTKIMASKEKVHSKLISAAKEMHQQMTTTYFGNLSAELVTKSLNSNPRQSCPEDWSIFHLKKLQISRGKWREITIYISYAPADLYTEEGLSSDKMSGIAFTSRQRILALT